jgi:hypothetical protein
VPIPAVFTFVGYHLVAIALQHKFGSLISILLIVVFFQNLARHLAVAEEKEFYFKATYKGMT